MVLALIQNLVVLASVSLGASLALTVGVSHRHLCALISFAAGILFATTLFHILPEASDALDWFPLLGGLASGYLLFYVMSSLVFHVCPACAASHFDEQVTSAFKSIAFLLTVALGVHCVMDGMAIALGMELETQLDRSIFLAVALHKFPEGLALAALLLKARFTRIQALGITLGIESLTFFGWLLGFFGLQGLELQGWFYFLLVHIGGGFIYLALHALVNESKEHSPRYIIFFFLLGIGLIVLFGFLPA